MCKGPEVGWLEGEQGGEGEHGTPKEELRFSPQ